MTTARAGVQPAGGGPEHARPVVPIKVIPQRRRDRPKMRDESSAPQYSGPDAPSAHTDAPPPKRPLKTAARPPYLLQPTARRPHYVPRLPAPLPASEDDFVKRFRTLALGGEYAPDPATVRAFQLDGGAAFAQALHVRCGGAVYTLGRDHLRCHVVLHPRREIFLSFEGAFRPSERSPDFVLTGDLETSDPEHWRAIQKGYDGARWKAAQAAAAEMWQAVRAARMG